MSLVSLCNLLLIAGGLFAVSKSKKRRRRTWLFATMWSYFSFVALMFFDISIYGEGSYVAYLLQYPAVLALAYSTCEFSMSMAVGAGLSRPRYFRPIVLVSAVIWVIGMIRTVMLGGEIYNVNYTLQLILPIGLIVFNGIYLGQAVSALTGAPIYNLWQTLKRMQELPNAAKAVGGLFVVLLLCVVGVMILLIMRESTFEREYMLAMFAMLNTVIIGTIVLTYLNFVEERLELSTKITGVLLVFVLGASSVLGSWLFEEEEVMLPRQKQLLANQNLTYTPRGKALYEIGFEAAKWDLASQIKLAASDEQPAIIHLPFSFPFFGENYTELMLHPRGYAVPFKEGETVAVSRDGHAPTSKCFGTYPAIVPFCSGLPEFDVYTHISDEKVIVTWIQSGFEGNIVAGGTSQLQVTPDGVMSFSYRDFPELGNAMWYSVVGVSAGVPDMGAALLLGDLPVAQSGKSLWFDLSLEQRVMIHERAWPIILLLILIAAILQFAYKKYLDRVLVSPLENILGGLQKVDDGRLDVTMTETDKDEFGDIARGFNQMISSLNDVRQERDEQTELLETELTYRTIEIANRGDAEILSKDEVFERRIREVIEANMSNFDFHVGMLAEEMAVSTRQLHRKVVTLTAKTPAALVRTIRLERAKQLLTAQAVNVSEASYQTGFKDVGYFSKLFTKQFGVSPSELLNK